MAAKPNNAPAGFLVIVALSVVHSLGGVLCHDLAAAIPGEDACAVWRLSSRVCLIGFMCGAASMRLNEKLVRNLLIPIVPPPLPPRLCIYVSGCMDVAAALLLALPGGELWGATACLTMLLCVFPANIYHCISTKAQAATRIGPPAVYYRLPIQLTFAAWARWHVTA